MSDVPKGLEVTAAKARELIVIGNQGKADRRRWILDVVSERLLIYLLDAIVKEALDGNEVKEFSWNPDDIWELAVVERFPGSFADECDPCLTDIGAFLYRGLLERKFQTDVRIGSKARSVHHRNGAVYTEVRPCLDICVSWVTIG